MFLEIDLKINIFLGISGIGCGSGIGIDIGTGIAILRSNSDSLNKKLCELLIREENWRESLFIYIYIVAKLLYKR